MPTPLRITTIGDGAMATVCSNMLAREAAAEVEVTVWGRNAEQVGQIAARRENMRYLPGVALSPALRFEADDRLALARADLVLCAVPTQFIRAMLTRLRGMVPAGVPVVSVSKGIEVGTLRRPSEIILEVLGERPVAALSGPCIAGELARRLTTTMVVAAAPSAADFARRVQEIFSTSYLRIYRNDDLPGVELAGATKNVIAIAAGMLDGMRSGNNAKAALLTRGLVEISRLGVALGAAPETFAGLAGLGDLVTTCFSPEGRNRTFGERVGRGESPAVVAASMAGVVEGMPTCQSVLALARRGANEGRGVEMPISESLHGVLFEGRDPRAQLAELMARELKSETG